MAGGNRLYRVVGTLDLTTKRTKNTKVSDMNNFNFVFCAFSAVNPARQFARIFFMRSITSGG